MSKLLKRCLDIADLNRHAHRKLPSPIYGYLERGADDEYSLNNNTDALISINCNLAHWLMSVILICALGCLAVT